MSEAADRLTLTVVDGSEVLTFTPQRLVVAGYTARDEAAARAHIAELAEIGVPPPATVPAFYHLDPDLLTTSGTVEVGNANTSGEVEPVLVHHDGRWFIGVGSDHTDRDLERQDVGDSKAACPKPLGKLVAALPESTVAGAFDAAWDRTAARSTVDGRRYQDGSLAALRMPSDLLGRLAKELDVGAAWPDDLVVYAGTLPLLDGEFKPGTHWDLTMTLELPAGPTTLSLTYDVTQRRR